MLAGTIIFEIGEGALLAVEFVLQLFDLHVGAADELVGRVFEVARFVAVFVAGFATSGARGASAVGGIAAAGSAWRIAKEFVDVALSAAGRKVPAEDS